MTADLRERLSNRKSMVETLIVDACRTYLASESWDRFDVHCSLRDLWNLSQQDDCCYDRPSIGLAYALWYHARRTHDVVRALSDAVASHRGPLDVLDLGCGTGATLWALAVLLLECPEIGPVRYHGVDGSPPMLGAAESMAASLLDSDACTEAGGLMATFACGNWTQPSGDLDHPWIVGSYLFDDSDADRVSEVGDALARLALHERAPSVHLLGTPAKEATMRAGVARLADAGGVTADVVVAPSIWAGDLLGLHDLRRSLYQGITEPRWAHARPSFDRQPQPIAIRIDAGEDRTGQLDLPPMSSTVLDPRQEEAASVVRRSQRRPTPIIGAAGSGKSRVLIERVARTLEEQRRTGGPANILVTTFNRAMVAQLGTWLTERLRGSPTLLMRRSQPKQGEIRFQDPRDPLFRVRLLHWDLIPTRVFGVASLRNDSKFDELLADRLEKLPAEHQRGAHGRVTDPRFLAAEMHRIIWGLGIRDEEAYLTKKRRGRADEEEGQGLGRRQRAAVWWMLMGPGHPELFPHVRFRSLDLVRAEDLGAVPVFTDLFIDECQDFTPADFELAAGLVDDARTLTVFGDETQAMHLGPAYRRPGTVAGRDGQSRRWAANVELEGSYRLPLRICECVQPLARHLAVAHRALHDDDGEPIDIVLPEAVKTAVLGIRPIVIAGDEASVAVQIRRVLDVYRPLVDAAPAPRRVVTLAEGDQWLQPELAKQLPKGVRLEVTSMRSIKGLERPCVVWSTRAHLDTRESAGEWVYTILTRTTALLIIVVCGIPDPEIVEILKLLPANRLLFWTAQAEEEWHAL